MTALSPTGEGPPWYVEVDEPACEALCPVPDDVQALDGLPPEVECSLPAGHDGSHIQVWDAWDGHALGWPQ